MGVQIPIEWAFLRGMMFGLLHAVEQHSPSGSDVGISRMLSTSLSNGRLQKQLSVTLNFPNEKSPCNVACRQNSLTICFFYFVAY